MRLHGAPVSRRAAVPYCSDYRRLGPTGVGRVIADVLMARDDWRGHFSVRRAPGRIRVRVLPAGVVGTLESCEYGYFALFGSKKISWGACL